MIVVGIGGLFAGLWLAVSLGWAFVFCSMALIALGVVLASIESETAVADTEDEPMQSEPPSKVIVKMRSPFQQMPARRKGA